VAGFERIVVPRPENPPCPAAALVSEAAGGTGCECRITRDLISSRRNPSTLASYCFSSDGYRECPTWRADREEFWRSKTVRDLLGSRGDPVGGHPEDREREKGLSMAVDAQEREAWERQQQRER
jgi:hypothetical protein